MDFFGKSDKKSSFSYIPENFELNLGDISTEFSSVREGNKLFFGRFHKEEIQDLLEESGIWTILSRRGYVGTILEIVVLSYLDNRIYIKNNKGEILIHMRLKVDDYYFKKVNQTMKLVFIDWLLTQNINFKNSKHKDLFKGQDFPGLNIFKEITYFIKILSDKLGSHGVYNVPEYFHDAILFHKYFKYVDPQVEGEFISIINSFNKKNLRSISEAIHNERLIIKKSNEIYKWKHDEMIYSDLPYIQEQIFDKSYILEVNKYSTTEFSLIN